MRLGPLSLWSTLENSVGSPPKNFRYGNDVISGTTERTEPVTSRFGGKKNSRCFTLVVVTSKPSGMATDKCIRKLG